MSLPVLPSRPAQSSQDLVRLFLRAERHWTSHIGEETAVSAGTAFTNPALGRVYDANRMLEVAVPADVPAEQAFDEVQGHYRQLGTKCWTWVLAAGEPSPSTKALIDALVQRGYRRIDDAILHLDTMLPDQPPAEIAGLMVIPARASFRHFREISAEGAADWNEPQLVDASELHLDDPHYDALIALKDGAAVATCGVLAVGDFGTIQDVYVSKAHRRSGIGMLMMQRAMEICARSLFKHVMICTQSDNVAALSLYRRLGFSQIGTMVSYRAPADAPAG